MTTDTTEARTCPLGDDCDATVAYMAGRSALAAENAALRAELADGSFYKEADIDAMQSTIAGLRADNDRLRGCVSDLLALMPDDEGPEITAARAALGAKP